jgi:hypothetical protein
MFESLKTYARANWLRLFASALIVLAASYDVTAFAALPLAFAIGDTAPAQPSFADMLRADMAAQNLIRNEGVDVCQQIYTTTVAAPTSGNNVVNIVPRLVGLIQGFWIEVTGTVTNTNAGSSGTALTRSDFGPANILSRIQFNDLSNFMRHNTSGLHMWEMASARGGRMFASANTLTSYPFGTGLNWTGGPICAAPSSIAASATGTVSMLYWVPLCYSKGDMRGAIYANVTNANMNLQLTINPTPSVVSGDSLNAIYSGNSSTLTNVTITVYQQYWDQLPQGPKGVVLPVMSLSTNYQLQDTTLSGVTAGQDFNVPYGNFRTYMSTFLIYNQNGTRVAGTDINYLAIQAANFLNITKADPYLWALWTRQMMGDDFPVGVYYIDHRSQPIRTNQYGNIGLILNAITAAAQTSIVCGYEFFSTSNLVTTAGSLPTGGA